MGAPVVTVGLVTYRRPDSLARALGGLADQQLDLDWELLVVDNDEAASAAPVVETFRDRIQAPIRVVVERKPGAAHARNRAIAEAAGELLVMHDDDVVAPPGWLATLLAPLRSGEADVVGGRVVLDPTVTRPAWFDEPGLGGYLTAFDLGAVPRPLDEEEYLVTANLAARIDLLRATDGFDPALGPRGRRQIVCDDVQLVRDLRAAGGRVLYTPDAWVTHELPAARLRKSWLLRRSYWQGRSEVIVDRASCGTWALGGSVAALRWLRASLANRRADPPHAGSRRFTTLTDVVRTAGRLRETAPLAVTQWPERRRRGRWI
jgi:glucosyl-dolichyl phosphate glucuronosyltransferase